jgi:two-component system, OmpR family, sensor histidine kinase MprB
VSLRWKIALALMALTIVASGIVGLAGYRLTRDRLLSEVDRSLLDVNTRAQRGRLEFDQFAERRPFSGFEAQMLAPGGAVVETTLDQPFVDVELAGSAETVAGRPEADAFDTVTIDGAEYRVRTVGLPRGALQVARSLEETERVLRSLRMRIVALSLIVAAVAAAVGLWIANSVTAPLRRLTAAAEHVESTGSLDGSVGSAGDDEVGRLSAAFDRMLATLARSRQEQQRLVEDAGHELRTPLTSLRTNVDVLRRHPDLSQPDREAVLADLHAEAEELTGLVNEIVALAVGELADEPKEQLDLTELARDLSGRYERRTGRRIIVVGEQTPVVAQRAAVQRALSCLLDNARKFDPGDGPIEVTVDDDGIAVADHGPGIPEGELALVFDRFHRADEARSMPGSGLGLSIVRDVAERHGGRAFARNRSGGGAVVGFTLS